MRNRGASLARGLVAARLGLSMLAPKVLVLSMLALPAGAEGNLASKPVDGPHVLVPDTLKALEAMGVAARDRSLALRAAVTGFFLGAVLAATALYIGGKTGIWEKMGNTEQQEADRLVGSARVIATQTLKVSREIARAMQESEVVVARHPEVPAGDVRGEREEGSAEDAALGNGDSFELVIFNGSKETRSVYRLDAGGVTTLIAGVVLFTFGTGPVRGFAVVHCLGILTSMFSAVVFSRGLVNLWYGRQKKLKGVSIGQIWKPGLGTK